MKRIGGQRPRNVTRYFLYQYIDKFFRYIGKD
jgi:hypothetical protein